LNDPLIVDVRRNALDDGPGIRSVVFFKGCPLRCSWCQNPETLSARPQLQPLPGSCADCGSCSAACTRGIARPATEPHPAPSCAACGDCVAACRVGARRIAGRRWAVEGLVSLLLRDEPFYRHSGGGVTLSGGEPTLYPRYTGALAAALRKRGVHVLAETCGLFDRAEVERHLLPHLSTVYFDLKLMDEGEHRQHTGRGNRAIHDNLRWLAGLDRDLLVRLPLVPGITDTPENLVEATALLRDLGLRRVALLAYHPLWVPKRRALGLDLPYDHEGWMSAGAAERCRVAFDAAGIEVLGA